MFTTESVLIKASELCDETERHEHQFLRILGEIRTSLPSLPKKISTKLPTTMIKSKEFHGSLK